MRKKKISFSFHSLFSSSLYIFSYSLYFSILFFLLSLTQLFKTALVLTLWDFTSFLSSAQMAEWPLPLFLHLFLLFSLSHSSHQVTLNASQLIMTLLQPISFLQLSHTRMTMPFTSFFSFFLPTCMAQV